MNNKVKSQLSDKTNNAFLGSKQNEKIAPFQNVNIVNVYKKEHNS